MKPITLKRSCRRLWFKLKKGMAELFPAMWRERGIFFYDEEHVKEWLFRDDMHA
jgi:hypothetical protein